MNTLLKSGLYVSLISVSACNTPQPPTPYQLKKEETQRLIECLRPDTYTLASQTVADAGTYLVAQTRDAGCEYRYNDSVVGKTLSLKKVDDEIHLFVGEVDTGKTFPIGAVLSIIIEVYSDGTLSASKCAGC